MERFLASITNSTTNMARRVTEFSEAALAVLDAMAVDPNATYFYEHLSGGFIWRDEFPELCTPEWRVVSHDCIYRFLVHIRCRITLGDAELELHPLWQQVVNGATNWPGLLLERRSGRIVKRLRAAERLAERCYKKIEAEDLE